MTPIKMQHNTAVAGRRDIIYGPSSVNNIVATNMPCEPNCNVLIAQNDELKRHHHRRAVLLAEELSAGVWVVDGVGMASANVQPTTCDLIPISSCPVAFVFVRRRDREETR